MEEIACSDINETPAEASVVVVNQMNFQPVEEARDQRPSLQVWWPSTARILIDGLFGGVDERRAAARAILPVCDLYVKVTPMELRMMTPEMRSIHNVYSAKLVCDERDLSGVVDEWIGRVNDFYKKAKKLVDEQDKTIADLRRSAKMLHDRHNRADKAAIISERLAIFERRVFDTCELELRVLRADAKAASSDPRTISTFDENRLREVLASTKVTQDVLGILASTYEAHRKNIEADAASRIEEACHQWLTGLRFA